MCVQIVLGQTGGWGWHLKGGHGLGWLEGNWGGFGATQAPMRVVCGLGGEKAGMFASEN